jgi:hypothetical protein
MGDHEKVAWDLHEEVEDLRTQLADREARYERLRESVIYAIGRAEDAQWSYSREACLRRFRAALNDKGEKDDES